MTFPVGTKVVLAHPSNIADFDEYADEWMEFWHENQGKVFVVTKTDGDKTNINIPKEMFERYGIVEIALSTFFWDKELEKYVTPLPEELFVI